MQNPEKGFSPRKRASARRRHVQLEKLNRIVWRPREVLPRGKTSDWSRCIICVKYTSAISAGALYILYVAVVERKFHFCYLYVYVRHDETRYGVCVSVYVYNHIIYQLILLIIMMIIIITTTTRTIRDGG